MAMDKNTTIAIGVGMLALIGIVAVASADDKNGNGNGNGKKNGNGNGNGNGGTNGNGGGTDTNGNGETKGGGKGSTTGESGHLVNSSDLWVSPDCQTIEVGADWWDNVGNPEITEWSERGFPATYDDAMSPFPQDSPEYVVREILGRYSPLCIDVIWWPDIWQQNNPVPVASDYDMETDAGYNEYLEAFGAWGVTKEQLKTNTLDAYGDLAVMIDLVYNAVVVHYAGGPANA